MKIIEDWKSCWRWLSVQAMVLAGAVQGAWAFIPDDLKSSMPHGIVQGATIALLVLGVAGRLVDQSKKDAP